MSSKNFVTRFRCKVPSRAASQSHPRKLLVTQVKFSPQKYGVATRIVQNTGLSSAIILVAPSAESERFQERKEEDHGF